MSVMQVLVTSVAPAEDSPGRGLLEAGLDAPARGASSDRHSIEVAGWALGAEDRAARVEVLSGGEVIQSFPVGQWRSGVCARHPCVWASTCGFSGRVSTLDLPSRFELVLRVVLHDGSTAPLATIGGRGAPVTTGYSPRLAPLLVTSTGRSGTTLLMHLLAQSPQVACGSSYPYELRIARYWLHQLALQTAPADHALSVDRNGFGASAFLGGRNPFNDDRAGPLAGWLQGEHIVAAAAFTQQQIDRAYELVAAAERPPKQPIYFAEKSTVGRHGALAHRLYPGARELILVRDLRDVYCSVVAFEAMQTYADFRRKEDGEEAYIRSLGETARALLDAIAARGAACLLVRYEELVRDPVGVLREIVAFLGLPDLEGVNAPQALVERASASDGKLSGHRTTGAAEESIGRWRRDLPAELTDVCAEFLDAPLAELGYAPTR